MEKYSCQYIVLVSDLDRTRKFFIKVNFTSNDVFITKCTCNDIINSSNMFMQPPSEESWNGNQLGYQVWYSQLAQIQQDMNNYQQVTVAYPTTSVELTNLMQNLYYEIKVNAFNNKGHGPFSRPFDVFVGEAGKFCFDQHFCHIVVEIVDSNLCCH